MWNEMVKTTSGGGYFGDSLRALSLLSSSGQLLRPT
jgi:hypothetical protein